MADESYRVALLADDLPQYDLPLTQQLEKTLKNAGFSVSPLSVDAICDSTQFNVSRYDLLVLPNASTLPHPSACEIGTFLEQGGDLLALNAPAFTQILWKSGDGWDTEAIWRKRLSEIPMENRLFDFETQDLTGWQRSTNAPESLATYEIVKDSQGCVLHARVENMTGWDTFSSPDFAKPIPAGHSLIGLKAKGVGDIRALSLECMEKDGSRWIAVFPVADQWKRIVLTPGDFVYWQSTPGRGGQGDVVNLQNVVRMQVGVAWTHTGQRGGAYEYYIDDIGTSPNSVGELRRSAGTVLPIEGLCPGYKFYPVTDIACIKPRWLPAQSINLSIAVPNALQAHHPRPTGQGFNKERNWRWIPLLEAYGPKGEWRGAPAGLFVDAKNPKTASVRAWFSVGDPEWYKQPVVQQIVTAVVKRMSRQVFLIEAGSEFFAYRSDEPVVLGAKIANFSRRKQTDYSLQYEVVSKDNPDKPLFTSHEKLSLAPGEIKSTSFVVPFSLRSYKPKDGEVTQLAVRTTFNETMEPVDRISCDLTVFEPKSENERKFVSTNKGDFMLDGKKWYAHGVNYMPSTGIGVEDGGYFEYWLGKKSYDPEMIQRDLERCRDLGLNSVSIFIHHNSVPSRNLLDILWRCEKLGLKVNLSIRPGTPLEYDWNQWKEIIEFNRLREWDAIYAYDIAWEPFFGDEGQRRAYDPQWREWIVKKYGTVESAEKSWGVPARRIDGQASTPSAEQLGSDGPHRKMVADYRRFVDALLDQYYKKAAEKIRAVDPKHLVSFRMTVTGDPTFLGDTNMPYDFKGVAGCMDFLAPEGYGRIGGWEQIKPGVFTAAYARYCAPQKPVLWAEAGVHVWNEQTMQSDPERLDFQGRFYEDFYRMLLMSYSNGVVWWWYPGGYRANERSDYGIINPDGTDRPNSKIIRRYAAEILKERAIPKPDIWIPIDRDADARGLYGIYARVKEPFWSAIDAGKTPGLKSGLK